MTVLILTTELLGKIIQKTNSVNLSFIANGLDYTDWLLDPSIVSEVKLITTNVKSRNFSCRNK